ncbi:hypothetical protein [Yeosuana marina]|uniref:hypothetical protein n=1 Tax=Yeosuana marina TaxID=1565536 RepID=UPI0030C83903
MKKTIYITTLIILLIGLTIGFYLFNKSMEIATYQSPDGNYELILVNGQSIFTMTMPGDGGRGSMPIDVILKDAKGNIIAKSRGGDVCSIFYDSINVIWDLENQQVWYGKARSINLKTGKVNC